MSKRHGLRHSRVPITNEQSTGICMIIDNKGEGFGGHEEGCSQYYSHKSKQVYPSCGEILDISATWSN